MISWMRSRVWPACILSIRMLIDVLYMTAQMHQRFDDEISSKSCAWRAGDESTRYGWAATLDFGAGGVQV